MEYIQHGDLAQYIRDRLVSSETETKEIVSQILEGLVILHEREICHRDLKPQVRHQLERPIRIPIPDTSARQKSAGY